MVALVVLVALVTNALVALLVSGVCIDIIDGANKAQLLQAYLKFQHHSTCGTCVAEGGKMYGCVLCLASEYRVPVDDLSTC